MASSPGLRTIRSVIETVTTAVTQWELAARGWTGEVGTGEVGTGGREVLSLADIPSRPANVRGVLTVFAAALLRSPDKDFRQTVSKRLTGIVVEALITDATLLRLGSDLAFEVASRRALLNATDRFDISANSALALTALVNLRAGLDWFRQKPGQTLPADMLPAITWPLHRITEKQTPVQPGDFWILDLVARTVLGLDSNFATRKELPGEQMPATDVALVQRVAADFVATSTVTKILEAHWLPAWLLRKGQYKTWPGIERIIAEEGTDAIRSLLIGELARQTAADSKGTVLAAVSRLLEAVQRHDSAPLGLPARQFAADLMWEMLESAPDILQQWQQRKEIGKSLISILHFVERPTQEWEKSFPLHCHRLAETRHLLQTYDSYRTLAALTPRSETPPAGTPPTAAAAVAKGR